jgi:RNA polymerase sigma-70 factor (ECF subfamily)
MYRIVTNLCLDHLRKSRNRRENNAFEVNAEGGACDLLNQLSDQGPANNPEQQWLSQEMSVRILCALQGLTPRERMVFELKHFQGLKLRAVGEILNSPEESIKTTLLRATQKLRSQLAGLTLGSQKEKKYSIKQRCDT